MLTSTDIKSASGVHTVKAGSVGIPTRSDLIDAVQDATESNGGVLFIETVGGRPDLLVLDRKRGIVAIDIAVDSPGPQNLEPIKQLNQKLSIIRDDIPLFQHVPLTRYVIHDQWLGDGEAAALSGPTVLQDDKWLSELPVKTVDEAVIAELCAALGPAFEFSTASRTAPLDPGSGERATARIRLDHEQQSIAMREMNGLTVLTGSAGSGKTMVLAARARWLAENHPDWRVQILCYNRMLAPYLRRLVGDNENIQISTFGKFSHAKGHSISLSDEASAAATLSRATNKGIDRTVDALLIDEWQDFLPSWTEFCLRTLVPNRGGALLVKDDRQALYRDDSGLGDLAAIDQLSLTVPYRSTRQILAVTAALDPAFQVEGIDRAPEGVPVELIWAETPKEQARAIAFDIKDLINTGSRSPRDFGVLVTAKRSIGRVAHALKDADVPFQVVKAWAAGEFDPSLDAVTISTVHSAKGHEFPVVCLIGLEELPDPDGTAESTRRGGRVGYVGTTRAQDQLMMTYTKDNVFLERLRQFPDVRQWVWPDDYGLGE